MRRRLISFFSLRRQQADGKEEAATDGTSQVVRGTQVGVPKCQWAFEGGKKLTKQKSERNKKGRKQRMVESLLSGGGEL